MIVFWLSHRYVPRANQVDPVPGGFSSIADTFGLQEAILGVPRGVPPKKAKNGQKPQKPSKTAFFGNKPLFFHSKLTFLPRKYVFDKDAQKRHFWAFLTYFGVLVNLMVFRGYARKL